MKGSIPRDENRSTAGFSKLTQNRFNHFEVEASFPTSLGKGIIHGADSRP